MIQNDNKQVIERSEGFKESTFRIKASAKAFRILSDGLYSDKITAILRELSCNAYDAHVSAGKLDTPFLIHLPNNLESFFSLRDYGTGLSEDDVINIFTTYFESTKTNTNDQIGCLGLGSKSPFSYTDSFTVTSFFNGTKSIYNMFLNEDEIPAVAKIGEEVSTEPNGLEISFAVKSRDVYEFFTKATNVFTYFKLKPIIVGRELTIPLVKYTQKRDGKWGLRDANNWGSPRAVMGNVAYEMGDATFDTLTEAEKLILKLNMDIFFDIGELDVSASREKLSYNGQTKINIKKKLEIIVKELEEEINLEIANCKSLYDAKALLHELTNGTMRVFRNIIGNIKVTFDGKPVDSREICLSDEDTKKFIVTSCQFSRTGRRSYKEKYNQSMVRYVVASKVHRFFVCDVTKNIKTRIKKFLEEQKALNNGNPIQVSMISPTEPTTIADAIDAFRTKMGMASDATIEMLSSLPFDPILRTSQGGGGTYNSKNTKKIFKFTGNGGRGNHTDNWEVCEPDLNDGGVYVIIDRYKINGEEAKKHLKSFFDLLKVVNPDEEVTIYGIKATEYAKSFASLKNWVTVKSYMENLCKEYIAENDLTDIQNIYSAYNSDAVRRDNGYWRNYRSDFIDYADSLIGILKYKKCVNMVKSMVKNEKIIDLLNDFLTEDDKKIKHYQKKFNKMLDEIKKDFPMLTMVQSFSKPTNKKIVKEYIKLMVDKMEKV